MKKIIVAFIITGFVFLFSGTAISGSGNKHSKGKEHKKEYCEKHQGKHKEKYHKKHHKKNGPPPHAPAHGYRHKHSDGVELEYHADRGIYVVIGFEDHYFHKDDYFRCKGGAWKKSKNVSGPWVEAPSSILPPGLPPLPPPPPKKSMWNLGRLFGSN